MKKRTNKILLITLIIIFIYIIIICTIEVKYLQQAFPLDPEEQTALDNFNKENFEDYIEEEPFEEADTTISQNMNFNMNIKSEEGEEVLISADSNGVKINIKE